jgi:hypothetical protein
MAMNLQCYLLIYGADCASLPVRHHGQQNNLGVKAGYKPGNANPKSSKYIRIFAATMHSP